MCVCVQPPPRRPLNFTEAHENDEEKQFRRVFQQLAGDVSPLIPSLIPINPVCPVLWHRSNSEHFGPTAVFVLTFRPKHQCSCLVENYLGGSQKKKDFIYNLMYLCLINKMQIRLRTTLNTMW